MKEFISKVLAFRENFVIQSISRLEISKIKNVVIKYFNLKDEYQLKDRLDGAFFLNNFIKNIGGIIALEKFFNIDLIDLQNINPSSFSPIIEINKKKYLVITFNYGEFPSVDPNNEFPVIFIINKDYNKFFICGVANIKSLRDKNNFKEIKTGLTRSSNNNLCFTNFHLLSKIENLKII